MANRQTATVLTDDRMRQAQDSRRAALNLMEDAVRARQLAEDLNRQLRNEITERQRAEEELRASAARYRALFESIDEGFCIIEKVDTEEGQPLDFRYVEANPAFAAQAGVGGVVGKTIRQAFPGEPEEWFITYDAIVRTGEPIRFERGLVTQGRVLELYAFRVDDDTHRRVAVIFKDISEGKKAEEALRASEERLQLSQQVARVGTFDWNLETGVNIWTPELERMYGLPPGGFARTQPAWESLVHPEDLAGVQRQVNLALQTGEPGEAEWRAIWPDGTVRWLAARFQAFRGQSGKPVRLTGVNLDITERRAYEKTLSESDRHKNEFLAMLAHELRNPLAPILASIEILRRAKGLGDGDAHALDVLRRQVGQMMRLVDDLLDVGRISRGKIDLRKERVELSSVVYHAVEAVRPISDSRTQELTVTLPIEPAYLNADPTRLAQIVGNLLNNASKFTDRGGHIWLTVEREDAFGDDHTEGASNGVAPQVALRVRDTGIGIAVDQLEHVFEMFTQVDTSLERSLTGLGIGLTLVKTLTEMHGGTVDVSSAGRGQGSEFVVRLPLDVDSDTPRLLATTMEPPVTTPLRILIVDDNRDSTDMLAMLLELAGHETHTAHDGLAAMEQAARLDPDVILLDIGLPDLNGYEVARRIRDQQRDKRRPVLVALTGWGQDEDRRQSEAAGFDAHVVKPVDHVVLGKLLAQLGAGRHEGRD